MRLSIPFFSGTGNTDYVAHYLVSKLTTLPVDIELHSIERQLANKPPGALGGAEDRFDLLALGFPVYAGDAPDLVHEYIARLPSGEGRGAFVFCTKGAMAGGAIRRNLARLQRRGYVPLGGQAWVCQEAMAWLLSPRAPGWRGPHARRTTITCRKQTG